MDDLQCRILTSGTSGTPRPVDLTYGNFLFSAVGSAFNIGIEPEDRWLCCLPLSHVAGLSIILRSVIYGTTAVLMDGFDTEKVASTLVSGDIGVLSLVPTQLIRLLDAGADLSAPRAILIGGGPVPEAALHRALDQGATVVQTYGMTETCSQVTTLAPADAERKVGSAGRPLLTSHVRIEDGEILVQGPTVSRGGIDPDGWLHTGDLGHIDDEGFLYVTGRRSEVIVTGGENVMPAEVEAVLVSHDAVADAAVVGRPDPEWQEAVCALVVLADGAGAREEELREHCAATLARHKVPKQVDFVSSLPRTASGKLLRGPYKASYDATYTVVRSAGGEWRVEHSVTTPLGEVK
jgi:O-succinylbenzoic acid--CoA ligase